MPANRTSNFEPRASPVPASPRRRRGAPQGNLNALKHGGTSSLIQALAGQLLAHPDLATRDGAQTLLRERLATVMREEIAAHQQAKERARRLLEPYETTRLVDRIARRLLLTLLEDEQR